MARLIVMASTALLVAACGSTAEGPVRSAVPTGATLAPPAVPVSSPTTSQCYFTMGPVSYYVAACDSDLGGIPLGEGQPWTPSTASPPVMVTAPPPTPTPAPTPKPSPRPTPDPFGAVALGTRVALSDPTHAPFGDISASKYRKAASCGYMAAHAGTTFVEVFVTLTATSGSWTYYPNDFAVHDASGYQWNTYVLQCDPDLGYGTLTGGRHVSGWVTFEVPASARQLWLDYRYVGRLRASWRVF